MKGDAQQGSKSIWRVCDNGSGKQSAEQQIDLACDNGSAASNQKRSNILRENQQEIYCVDNVENYPQRMACQQPRRGRTGLRDVAWPAERAARWRASSS